MSRWQGPCHQVLDQRLWVLWRLRAWPQASRAFDRNGCWASWLFNRSISLMRLMRSSSPYLRDLWEEHASGALHADYSDSLWEDVKEEGTQGKKWAKCQASRESEKKIVWTIRCRIKPCARKIYITTIEQISNKCTMNSAEVSRVWGKGLQHRHTVISFTSFARSGDWHCLQAVPVALRCKSRGGF